MELFTPLDKSNLIFAGFLYCCRLLLLLPLVLRDLAQRLSKAAGVFIALGAFRRKLQYTLGLSLFSDQKKKVDKIL